LNRRRLFWVVVLTLVFALVCSGVAQGFTGSRTLKAVYKNIRIIVNGTAVDSSEAPFIVGGRVYVPLRVVGEALNADVQWDGTTNSVVIRGGSSSQVSLLQLQLLQKENRIRELEAELNRLQEREVEEAASTRLTELEDDLLDDYRWLEDVKIEDISLEGDEENVEAAVEVDLDDYGNEWEELWDSDITDWLEDLVDDIQTVMGDECEVEGEITDTDSGDTLVEFEKDGRDDLEVSFEDEDYRGGGDEDAIEDVEDDLVGEYYYIGDIRFIVESVYYSTSSDRIYVGIAADDPDEDDAWDDLDEDEIEDDVEYICEDIADEFIDEAEADPEEVDLDVYSYDGELLGNYEYDVQEEELY